jgi:hypothetical protein
MQTTAVCYVLLNPFAFGSSLHELCIFLRMI